MEFSKEQLEAAKKIAIWWKNIDKYRAYLAARREFEEISEEIGDISPNWGQSFRSLPIYNMDDECQMLFAMSSLSKRRAELKYDEFVRKSK